MTKGRVLFAVLSVIILLPLFFFLDFLFSPMHFTTKSNMILVVDKNTSAKSLVANLKSKNLIKHDKLLLAYIRFNGIEKRIKAGAFEIYYLESIVHLLKRIVAFDVLKKTLQITAGNTNLKLATKLEGAEYLHYTASDWLQILPSHTNNLKICASNPQNLANSKPSELCINALRNIKKPQDLEGLFLADTYQYDAGSDAVTLLLTAHENLKKCLLKAWEQRSLGLPYASPYELLIAASILEKESATKEDRQLISGVIVNRLRKNMPLQMDPTVIYGLQDKYTGKLSHEDMQVVSKYNTYKNRGLPPTPISIVSCEAINAASNPTFTDYLYFVANRDGTHAFSKTYAEHLRLIKNLIN